MTKAEKLHNEAMNLAGLAFIHKNQNDLEGYLEYSKKALDLETQAANLLKDELTAEPTRSILFRSAASLAYNCNELKLAENLIFTALSGQPDPSIEYELRELLDNVNSVLLGVTEYEDNSYLQHLRDEAVHLRVQSSTSNNSKAIFVNNAVEFLRNITNSYKNFISVNFRKIFDPTEFGDDYNKILGQILSKTQLLVVDQRFKSFGVSISSDTSIMQQFYSREINDWRKELFSKYKDEVLYFDYESNTGIESLSERYDDQERKAIYKAFTTSFRTNSAYNVSITDRHYSKTLKKYKPLSKGTRNVLFPKSEEVEENTNKVLYQEFFMDIKDSDKPARKDDIIERKELEYAEFGHTLKSIENQGGYLVLNEELPLNIVYQDGFFSTQIDQLGIQISSGDYSNLISEIQERLINLYDGLQEVDENDLTVDQQDHKLFFESLVTMRSQK